MARKRSKTVATRSLRITKEQSARLEEHLKATGKSFTQATRDAIDLYIDTYNVRSDIYHRAENKKKRKEKSIAAQAFLTLMQYVAGERTDIKLENDPESLAGYKDALSDLRSMSAALNFSVPKNCTFPRSRNPKKTKQQIAMEQKMKARDNRTITVVPKGSVEGERSD